MILSAVKYLLKPDAVPQFPMVILFGDDAFLRAEVYKVLRNRLLGEEDADFSLVEYEGGSVRYIDMMREVSTPPLFGGSLRLVRMSEADSFVSENSGKLIEYLDKPSSAGVLLFQVKVLMKNSKLYEAVERKGLLIDVNSPSQGELIDWLDERVRTNKLKAPRNVLHTMVELVGSEPGLLDSEITRLALLNPSGGNLTPAFVSANIGSWRQRTVWDMIDAALDGDYPGALKQLNMLLTAGEQPIGVLAQMAATLRRLAASTIIFLDAERMGRRISVDNAVKQTGQYGADKLIRQMKRLGRRRGEKLAERVLKADLDLKGGTRVDSRIVLEELLAEISSGDLR